MFLSEDSWESCGVARHIYICRCMLSALNRDIFLLLDSPVHVPSLKRLQLLPELFLQLHIYGI